MQRPSYTRGFTNAIPSPSTPPELRTPTAQTMTAPHIPKALHVKRITLTSKKNWWMGELQVTPFFLSIQSNLHNLQWK